MGAAHKIIDKKTLQILVPFNALSPMHFNEVAQKTVVEEVRAGRPVFKEGDRDNQSVYLLEGEISLVSGNEIVGAVTAGSDASRHPLAHQQPRQVTARAKTNVVVAKVDSSLLDIMLTWDQSSGYEVAEIDDDDDDDWMTRILQSQAFLKLPPSNIQRLLMKVESISVNAGDVIIRQGGEGDYFYIIKNGRCMVSRRPSANAKEVKLAELADGDAFGEDALVSDAKRNATITMMTDGVLMRLAKNDFVELLKEPLLNKLAYPEAAALVRKGAVWLDVRLPGEFENVHIPDSRNIPLSALRLEANGLDARSKYIVCCDTGRRSASAAFVLSQRGFEVYVLNDGLGGVPADILAGNAATGTMSQGVGGPAEAEVVALKPHSSQQVTAGAAPETAEIGALQGQLEALQNDKQVLESAQTQLSDRISDLQLELERVREDAREQILELEQTLAEARQDTVAARDELQGLKDSQGATQQADQAAREQTEALEAELVERRAHEAQLQEELKSLQDRFAAMEAVHQEDVRLAVEADAARAGFQQQIEALQSKASEVDELLARIKGLEAALDEATQQGTETQADQARRMGELEAALQVATSALERAHQDAELRHKELAAVHGQELERTQKDAAQQIAELQARLDSLATERADLDARLVAASEALTQAEQTEQQKLTELENRITALTEELEQAGSRYMEQQALADATAREIAELREAQVGTAASAEAETARLRADLEAATAAQAALSEEHAALQSIQAAAAQEHQQLQDALAQAQERIREFQADAGEQVKHLESTLEDTRQQLEAARQEQVSLRDARERIEHEHTALQTTLEQAQARIEELQERAEQSRQLDTELETAREQIGTLTAERDQLQSDRQDVAAKLTAAEARIATLEQVAETHSGDNEGLQQRLDETRQALESAQQTVATLQAEREVAGSNLAELENRLAESEQAHARVLAERQADLDALRAEFSTSTQAQNDLAAEAEQRIHALEETLATARAESEQATSEHERALDEARQQHDATEHALAEARKQLDKLTTQQADAVSSQDEQRLMLGQLREELEGVQEQLRSADLARGEIEARLGEMTAAKNEAQSRLDKLQDEHKTALADTEKRTRAELEEQLDELKSELDSARAALAREMSERGNLEQAQQAKFDALQTDIEDSLAQAREDLQEREQALAEAKAAERGMEKELTDVRAAAETQQQALVAELEQLRMVTTADLEAMQKQLEQLKEELKAARKLSAGGPASEELERLRMLLDEAREEANSARADADQWREHALDENEMSEEAPEEATDEMAAMQVQLADIQSRVDDAMQLRDTALQEVAQLRQELQAQQLRQSMQAQGGAATSADVPVRRGGLWMGLTAGLILGVAGAGGALWYGQGGRVPVTADAKAVAAMPTKPVVSDKVAHNPTVPAPAAAKPAEQTAMPAPAAPAPVKPETKSASEPAPKLRELRDTLSDASYGPVLIEIPAVSYAMGSGISSLDFDERPKHDVKLRRFAIGKYEVTFDEYDAFARMTGRALPDDKGWGRGQRPVINVSWEEAVAYTQWLSEQTGKRYRLATEAEWEYAAGGSERTLYWWGNSPGEGRANCFNCGSEWDTHLTAPVGSFAANPLGLYDTSGNVSEWVQDCYHPSYEGAPRDGSAWVTVGCTRRVVRSGGFNSPANTLRITKRDQQLASMRADDLGFRVVREF